MLFFINYFLEIKRDKIRKGVEDHLDESWIKIFR
jgi:hypothetical protein